MESSINKADIFLKATEINRENLWKRRQIEWRTAFSLWTAIAVASGFIYVYAKRPIPSPYKWIFLIFVFIVYIIIVWLHHRHLKAIFISNERDFDFIHYYTNRAAWEIDNSDLEKPTRPEWSKLKTNQWTSKTEESKYYQERIGKMRKHYTPIIITGLISLLSWCILAFMCLEN
ncbi:hypothetical protein ACFLSE_07265 [Bacteroidota bacterium]